MDRKAWQATVCGITKSQTQLKLLSMQTCELDPPPKIMKDFYDDISSDIDEYDFFGII